MLIMTLALELFVEPIVNYFLQLQNASHAKHVELT